MHGLLDSVTSRAGQQKDGMRGVLSGVQTQSSFDLGCLQFQCWIESYGVD